MFGFFALVLVAVYWVNRAVSLFERLIGDGQTAMVVLEFTLLTLPVVISVVLPVAAFAATAYGTNRLSGRIRAGGDAGRGPVALAAGAPGAGLRDRHRDDGGGAGSRTVPMSRARLAERQAQIAENVTAQFLNAGVFQYPSKGITLFIREITRASRGLFLEDARNTADISSYSAERALLVKSGHRAEAGHGQRGHPVAVADRRCAAPVGDALRQHDL